MENQIRVVLDWNRFKLGRVVVCLVQVQDDKEQLIDQEVMIKSPLFLKWRLKRKMNKMMRRQKQVANFLLELKNVK